MPISQIIPPVSQREVAQKAQPLLIFGSKEKDCTGYTVCSPVIGWDAIKEKAKWLKYRKGCTHRDYYESETGLPTTRWYYYSWINSASTAEKKYKVWPLWSNLPYDRNEQYLVSIIIQLANMWVPITSSQGLALCNSIIQGTKFQKVIKDYKMKYGQNFTDVLGPSYWRGFLKQNKELIRSKRPVRFEAKRAEWCTYINMQVMYDEIYSQLVEVGLAVRHPEPVWH